MKVILQILFLLVVGTDVLANTCNKPITNAIAKLTKMDCDTAYPIAKIINRYATAKNLDWKLIVAIIMQESSFKVDAINCGDAVVKRDHDWDKVVACHDFGPMQVNYRIWSKAYNLDLNKMLSDWEYAIDTGTTILAKLKNRHSKNDPEFWWGSYNSVTPAYKYDYCKRVMVWLQRIEE